MIKGRQAEFAIALTTKSVLLDPVTFNSGKMYCSSKFDDYLKLFSQALDCSVLFPQLLQYLSLTGVLALPISPFLLLVGFLIIVDSASKKNRVDKVRIKPLGPYLYSNCQ